MSENQVIPEAAVEAAAKAGEMSIWLIIYLIGIGVWAFYMAIGYAFSVRPADKRWCARSFFAAPIWPVAICYVSALGVKRLWAVAKFEKAAK